MRIINFLKEYRIWLIVLCGLLARIIGINDVPPSLNWDEVSHGYNAYSILTTGKDEWGKTLPIIFQAYGDYKLPVYICLTAVSEFIFGMNALAVRMPSIIFGAIGVLLTYNLVQELFGKKRLSLLAAVFVLVEPWSFFLSRGAFEANVSWVLTLAGVVFFLKTRVSRWTIILSALLFGISVWTYNSARIFVPLLILLLIFLYKDNLREIWKKQKRLLLISSGILLFFLTPMFFQLTHISGQARYENVAILDQGAINQINELRGQSQLSSFLTMIFYNKVTYFSWVFTKNYLSHFSASFLFFKGGGQYQFNVPDYGLLFPVDVVLAGVGLTYLLKNKREKSSILLMGWLLLAPIASSLTREAPHALRASVMLPAPMIVLSLGFIEILAAWRKKFKSSKFFVKKLPNILYIVPLLFFSLSYYSVYANNYPTQYSWSWQYGYKDVAIYISENYNKYNQIIITKKYGEPHEFMLFYGGELNAPWNWQPEKYRTDANLLRFGQSNWFWVDKFDKFIFVNDWEVPKMENRKWKMERGGEFQVNTHPLLITSPGNYPPGWKATQTVYFLDGKEAFNILEKI